MCVCHMCLESEMEMEACCWSRQHFPAVCGIYSLECAGDQKRGACWDAMIGADVWGTLPGLMEGGAGWDVSQTESCADVIVCRRGRVFMTC